VTLGYKGVSPVVEPVVEVKQRMIAQTEDIEISNGKTLKHVIVETLSRKDGKPGFAPVAVVTIDLVGGTTSVDMKYPFTGPIAENVTDLKDFLGHAEKVASAAKLGVVFLKEEGVLTPAL